MVDNKSFSTQQRKTAQAEKLWLAYFNSYLHEHGIITEAQRSRILLKIENRKGSTSGKNTEQGKA